jgi:hypothetical protein
MQVQNATNFRPEVDTPGNSTPASIVSQLPSGALYSPSFQTLYNQADLPEGSAVPPRPQPYRLATTNQAQAEPIESSTSSTLETPPNESSTSSTLDTPPAAGGLGGLLNSLDTAGTSAQINDLLQKAQDAEKAGDGLTAQQDVAQAQMLFSTMTTMLNMIAQMQQEAIKNAKVS